MDDENEVTDSEEKFDSWKLRRRVVFGTLFYCMVSITYLMVNGEDTRLNESIATGLIMLASTVILYYVGASTYESSQKKSSSKSSGFR